MTLKKPQIKDSIQNFWVIKEIQRNIDSLTSSPRSRLEQMHRVLVI